MAAPRANPHFLVKFRPPSPLPHSEPFDATPDSDGNSAPDGNSGEFPQKRRFPLPEFPSPTSQAARVRGHLGILESWNLGQKQHVFHAPSYPPPLQVDPPILPPYNL